MATHICHLPLEIIKLVFLELDPKSYLRAGQVCQQWRDLTRSPFTLKEHIQNVLLRPDESKSEFHTWEKLATENENKNQDQSITDRSLKHDHVPLAQESMTDNNRLSSQSGLGLGYNHSFDQDKELERIYFKLLGMKFVSHNFSISHILSTHNSNRQKSIYRNVEHRAFSPDGTRYVVSYYDREPPNDRNNGYGANKRFYIYDISTKDVKLINLFTHICDRRITDISISGDNSHMAISYFPGYVEVLRIPDSFSFNGEIDPDSELGYSTRHRIFSRQYPSAINYMSVSNNGELLFIRSQRLGGLLLVNLDTQEEMDIPHYRLDLRMHLQNHDEVLALSGWSETIVYGHNRNQINGENNNNHNNISNNSGTQPRVLWKYYQHMISNHLFMYLHADFAIALGIKSVFLGFRGGDDDDIRIFLTEEAAPICGFKSLQEFIDEENDKNKKKNIDGPANQAIGLKRRRSQGNIETVEYRDTKNPVPTVARAALPQASAIAPSATVSLEPQQLTYPLRYTRTTEEGDTTGIHNSRRQLPERERNDDDYDESEEDTDSEFGSDGGVTLLIVKETESYRDIKYALTLDSTRLAIASHDKKLHIFSLNSDAIEYALTTNELPSRVFAIDLTDDEHIDRLQFIGRDKLMVCFHTATSVIYDFGTSTTEKSQMVRWELIDGRLHKFLDQEDSNDYDYDYNCDYRDDGMGKNKKQPVSLSELAIWCNKQTLRQNN